MGKPTGTRAWHGPPMGTHFVWVPKTHGYPWVISTPTATNKATTNIPKVARLLRQMYGLELLIWGSAGKWAKDPAGRERLVAQSSAIMAEVRATVRGWEVDKAVTLGWTEEERGIVREICEVVRGQGREESFEDGSTVASVTGLSGNGSAVGLKE